MRFGAQLYVDGKWRPGGAGSAPVINPATEETIGPYTCASESDLDDALAASERGFEQWRRTSPFERARLMRRAAELMRQRIECLARTMTMEQRKALAESRAEADAIKVGDGLEEGVGMGPLAHRRRLDAMEALTAEAGWAHSAKTMANVSRDLEAGMVSINHHGLALPEVPFGGIKDSGYGSKGGAGALEAYLNPKLVTQMT